MSCMKIISLLLSNIAYIANSICIVYPFNHANWGGEVKEKKKKTLQSLSSSVSFKRLHQQLGHKCRVVNIKHFLHFAAWTYFVDSFANMTTFSW